MRLIENPSFLEDSSFLYAEERRVLSCSSKRPELRPCPARPVEQRCFIHAAAKGKSRQCWIYAHFNGILTVLVPVFIFFVWSPQRGRRILRCCCHPCWRQMRPLSMRPGESLLVANQVCEGCQRHPPHGTLQRQQRNPLHSLRWDSLREITVPRFPSCTNCRTNEQPPALLFRSSQRWLAPRLSDSPLTDCSTSLNLPVSTFCSQRDKLFYAVAEASNRRQLVLERVTVQRNG